MQKSSAGGSSFEESGEPGDRAREVGDADNVQKTSYVVGRGTDPDAADPDRAAAGPAARARRGEAEHGYTATVRAGGGPNLTLWIVGALALVIAVVYGFGLFA